MRFSIIILVPELDSRFPHHTRWDDTYRSKTKFGNNRLVTAEDHITPDRACRRGLALIIVSSLCLIHSESLHGFCHFHLNCTNHWWWLLFHLHSFPACPPITASFFAGTCPMGTICSTIKSHFLSFLSREKKTGSNSIIWRRMKLTFRVWSMKASDSLTEPLTMPAVYFSCFCAGTETGDNVPFVSSAECFSELCEFPSWLAYKVIRYNMRKLEPR